MIGRYLQSLFRVWGLGFRERDLQSLFRVWGLGFGVWDSGSAEPV